MKEHGPWKIKSSVVKYENPWIEVREDQVIRPDGKDGLFGVVTMKSGASILALDDEGYVYLTEEFRYALGRISVEVVSGALDDGENLLQAAQRELKEEAGIEAEEWIDLGIVNPFTSIIDSPANIYLARKLRVTDDLRHEGTEFITLHKIKF